jgi:hypothetical protein
LHCPSALVPGSSSQPVASGVQPVQHKGDSEGENQDQQHRIDAHAGAPALQRRDIEAEKSRGRVAARKDLLTVVKIPQRKNVRT